MQSFGKIQHFGHNRNKIQQGFLFKTKMHRYLERNFADYLQGPIMSVCTCFPSIVNVQKITSNLDKICISFILKGSVVFCY